MVKGDGQEASKPKHMGAPTKRGTEERNGSQSALKIVIGHQKSEHAFRLLQCAICDRVLVFGITRSLDYCQAQRQRHR